MNNVTTPINQVYWYLNKPLSPALRENITVDVVVVGGGMAGLSAAQSFREKGLQVALLEKSFCGAGASGKSSGFITPDSEFSLHNMIKFYGKSQGRNLWDFALSGVKFIKSNIEKYKIDCDYQIEDTLVVATNKSAFNNEIEKEHATRLAYNFESKLYTQHELPTLLGSKKYYGGVCYKDTFGISAYRYCQAMKEILVTQGVQIFEESPVISFDAKSVTTPDAMVKADRIVMCMDRFVSDLNLLQNQVYHIQTFLMMSKPLSKEDIQKIFPQKPLMVWDTDLIYNYFRIAGDNRLMLGGARLLSTYARHEHYNNPALVKKLTRYFKSYFPEVSLTFEYIWPGLVGISKDIIPVAGPDKNNPSIYYISAAAGLPWAAALGHYSAEHILEKRHDLDDVFSPERKFALGSCVQKILGTPLTFALSNFMRTRSL
jgi:glycine/D-amino acid oxidase-like deaminating enzyme